jgi:hypothetical protein
VFDRNGLRVLPRDECIRLLATNELSLGRVAFVDYGRPIVLPVNYRIRDDAVIFWTDQEANWTPRPGLIGSHLRSTRSMPGGGKAGASSCRDAKHVEDQKSSSGYGSSCRCTHGLPARRHTTRADTHNARSGQGNHLIEPGTCRS